MTLGLCRLAVKEWAANFKRVNAVPQFEDAYDDLSDPLDALCSTAQVVAMKLTTDHRLETTLERASKFVSVQKSATVLAKNLGLM